MSEISTPTLKEALDIAAEEIKRGNVNEGREGLEQVLKKDPENVLALLWMTKCIEDPKVKLEYFERVLSIDPENNHALEGIEFFGRSMQPVKRSTPKKINFPPEPAEASPPSPAPPAKNRTCPFCAETIKMEAIVCRYCGRDLPEIIETSDSEDEAEPKPRLSKAFWIVVAIILIPALVIIIALLPYSFGPGTSSSSARGASWNCIEYDPPFDVVFIDGEADVYGGVEEPSSSVKGYLTDGAGGIEARCSKSGSSFYRLRGVEWWGWVKTGDTYR